MKKKGSFGRSGRVRRRKRIKRYAVSRGGIRL